MANWEKLNKEFDDCLDSMTKEDWDNWYKNVEQKRINQNKMTVTIEFEDKDEALQALNADRWQGAMFKLDQELRRIVKHGYIGKLVATDCEIECFDKCRKMLIEAMEDNNVTFGL